MANFQPRFYCANRAEACNTIVFTEGGLCLKHEANEPDLVAILAEDDIHLTPEEWAAECDAAYEAAQEVEPEAKQPAVYSMAKRAAAAIRVDHTPEFFSIYR